MRPFFYLGLLIASAATHAQVFQRVDPITGQITYTNRPPPGQEMQSEAAPAPFLAPQVRVNRSLSARKDEILESTPAAFPRVDTAEQKRRDLDRHTILTEELQAEVTAFEKLGKRPENEAQARRHIANIASLKRELANLR